MDTGMNSFHLDEPAQTSFQCEPVQNMSYASLPVMVINQFSVRNGSKMVCVSLWMHILLGWKNEHFLETSQTRENAANVWRDVEVDWTAIRKNGIECWSTSPFFYGIQRSVEQQETFHGQEMGIDSELGAFSGAESCERKSFMPQQTTKRRKWLCNCKNELNNLYIVIHIVDSKCTEKREKYFVNFCSEKTEIFGSKIYSERLYSLLLNCVLI